MANLVTSIRRAIAVFEVLSGLAGLLLGGRQFVAWIADGALALRVVAGVALLGCLTSVAAGLLLWRNHRLGYQVSVLLQAISIPTLTSRWFNYLFFVGVRVVLGFEHWSAQAPGLPPGSRATGLVTRLNLGAGFTIQYLLATPLVEIGVNVVALVALGALLSARPRPPAAGGEPRLAVAV